MSSMQQFPSSPNPVSFGWELQNQGGKQCLVIEWMDGDPAPVAVLEKLYCTCKRVCKSPNCACISNGLKYTELCSLSKCSNRPLEDDDEDIIVVIDYIEGDEDDA